MEKHVKRKLILILFFAIAMGFLEAIVVVYLRELYYPQGFNFPLVITNDRIFIAELLREICTIVMLLSLALIAGKNRLQAFAFFLFSFAVWDIFYYVALKLLLNWPSSLLTWDILFLIPITWLGPVFAPLICSVTMIILALVLLLTENRNNNTKLRKIEWSFLYLGAFIIFITFILDYSKILITNASSGNWLTFIKSETFKNIITNYIPVYYHWDLFALGMLLIYLAIFLIIKKNGILAHLQKKEKISNSD
ncbi:MAG: hypothetical protein PVH88_10735 [Ignavibacteria bacterium]|jgi:hypothetical protein